MEWKNEYSVGIREIDEQHKTIIECISSIKKAAVRFDRPSTDAAVVLLADLAQAHFTLEESLMRILDYPRLEEHAADHKTFSVHLRALQERFVTTDVFHHRLEILHEWWDTHVQKHDKSYALHLLKHTALGKS